MTRFQTVLLFIAVWSAVACNDTSFKNQQTLGKVDQASGDVNQGIASPATPGDQFLRLAEINLFKSTW